MSDTISIPPRLGMVFADTLYDVIGNGSSRSLGSIIVYYSDGTDSGKIPLSDINISTDEDDNYYYVYIDVVLNFKNGVNSIYLLDENDIEIDVYDVNIDNAGKYNVRFTYIVDKNNVLSQFFRDIIYYIFKLSDTLPIISGVKLYNSVSNEYYDYGDTIIDIRYGCVEDNCIVDLHIKYIDNSDYSYSFDTVVIEISNGSNIFLSTNNRYKDVADTVYINIHIYMSSGEG